MLSIYIGLNGTILGCFGPLRQCTYLYNNALFTHSSVRYRNEHVSFLQIKGCLLVVFCLTFQVGGSEVWPSPDTQIIKPNYHKPLNY